MHDLQSVLDALESRMSRQINERLGAGDRQRLAVQVTEGDPTSDDDDERKDNDAVRPVRLSQARQRVLQERTDKVLGAAQTANKDVLGAGPEVMFNMSSLLDPTQLARDADTDSGILFGSNTSKVRMGQQGLGKLAGGFHPDLFRTDTYDRPDVIKVLGSALSSASKTTAKFKNIDHMIEMFAAQVQTVAADPDDGVKRLLQWIRYERHIFKLYIDKGLDAASKYHFDLFSRVRAGEHDLWSEGYYNAQVMRDVDVTYPNTRSSFRGEGSKKARSGGSSKSSGAKFTGEPCKHHGPHAKHTTSECKDPDAKTSRK